MGQMMVIMDEVLKQCSAFEKDGKEYSFSVASIFAVKEDGSMRIADKWIASALGRLRKRGEVHE